MDITDNYQHRKVVDRRLRDWELFQDSAMYDMWCCRLVGDDQFNSTTSFHFDTLTEAEQFLTLIKVST